MRTQKILIVGMLFVILAAGSAIFYFTSFANTPPDTALQQTPAITQSGAAPSSEIKLAQVKSASNWSDAYARRNFRLGITLTEFKRTPYPDNKEWPNAYPVCSNGVPAKGGNDVMSQLNDGVYSNLRSHMWKDLGVTMCDFFYPSSGPTKVSGAGLMLGNVSPISNEFYFYPPEKGKEAVLFLVWSTFPPDGFDEAAAAFKDHLGEPKSRLTQAVQNKIGNTFQNTIITYENSSSLILLLRYGETLNKSSVKYVLKPVYDSVVNAEKSVRGPASDRL